MIMFEKPANASINVEPNLVSPIWYDASTFHPNMFTTIGTSQDNRT